MGTVRAWHIAAMAAATGLGGAPAGAWGNEGHSVIGLVAQQYLTPDERAEVDRLMSLPIDPDVPATMADRATWADKFRDSDRYAAKVRYTQTHNWHFVDLDVGHPDLTKACFGARPLPAGTPASQGPAADCVVGKIEQFQRELADRTLPDAERAKALMFLLHFVGDVHQPLHAAERANDQGGNAVMIVTGQAKNAANLHSYWDSATVAKVGAKPSGDPAKVAPQLLAAITAADVARWQAGGPRDWALESFAVAKRVTYGKLPKRTRACLIKKAISMPAVAGRCVQITKTYETAATASATHQLEAAGVRLAYVIHQALAAN